jgi:formylglycine-generating enzyme required for sulfatase activity
VSDIAKAEAKAKVFISYSRKDLTFADKLDAALRARGFDPLIDRDEIYAFEEWWPRIQSLITQADTIIFVLSPEAVTSDVCKKEVEFGASLNKRFAPVVCKRVNDEAVPAPLRRFNYIFCDDDAQFDARMDLLAEALATDIGWIRKHTEFEALAQRWELATFPRGMLLRSPMLEEAESWMASRPHYAPELTPRTRKFISESRRAVKQRLLQLGAAALMCALIVGIATISWANRGYLKLRWALWIGPRPLTADMDRVLKPKQEFKECARCPVMVVIPAGEFLMGSNGGEDGQIKEERPQHRVTISRSFAVSKFEITFDEWDTCFELGGCKERAGDQGWGRADRPAINVNWNDVKEYVAWLLVYTGKKYRLLSEAEWEYAARGGSETSFWWGNNAGRNNANCEKCGSNWDDKMTAPVGSFAANKFGLYDVHGNVWEWVEDCYQESYNGAPTDGSAWVTDDCSQRVVRGGSWFNPTKEIRSAHRSRILGANRDYEVGFRVARDLD